MKKLVGYIVVICVCMTFLYSCARRARLIPKSDMADIYAEFFVVDQWIPTQGLQRIADTSMVYAPILKKYGYTTEDFSYSVQKYMRDPDKFVKVFARSTKILNDRVTHLAAEEKRLRRLDSLRRARILKLEQSVFVEQLHAYRDRIGQNNGYGSRIERMEFDTCGAYLPVLATMDTTFRGPELIIAVDSISIVKDSLSGDSLSVAKLDSLAVKKMKPLMERKVKDGLAVPAKPIVRPDAVKAEELELMEEVAEEPLTK